MPRGLFADDYSASVVSRAVLSLSAAPLPSGAFSPPIVTKSRSDRVDVIAFDESRCESCVDRSIDPEKLMDGWPIRIIASRIKDKRGYYV